MSNDKFTMDLVWHDCNTNPPKENMNPCLIVTDGSSLWSAFYKDGRFTLTPLRINSEHAPREKKWWADPYQTIGGCERFKEEQRESYRVRLCVGCEFVVAAPSTHHVDLWLSTINNQEVANMIMNAVLTNGVGVKDRKVECEHIIVGKNQRGYPDFVI